MTTDTPIAVGDVLHVVQSGLTLAFSDGLSGSRVLARGETIHVTEAMLNANRDRRGASPLDLLDDEDAQAAAWGAVMIRRGPWPTGTPSWIHGSAEWEAERAEARRAAWASPEAERAAALAAVETTFGAARDTTLLLRRGEGT